MDGKLHVSEINTQAKSWTNLQVYAYVPGVSTLDGVIRNLKYEPYSGTPLVAKYMERDLYGTMKSSEVRAGDEGTFGPLKLIDEIIANDAKENNFLTATGLANPWAELTLNEPIVITALEFTAYGVGVCKKYFLMKCDQNFFRIHKNSRMLISELE